MSEACGGTAPSLSDVIHRGHPRWKPVSDVTITISMSDLPPLCPSGKLHGVDWRMVTPCPCHGCIFCCEAETRDHLGRRLLDAVEERGRG